MRGLKTLATAGLGFALLTVDGTAQIVRRPALRAGRQGPLRRIQKLQQMTPEERKKAMEKLPPDRQKQLENRLEKFENMTPEEQRQLAGRYEDFQKLPPERQEAARKNFRQFMNLPEERKAALKSELMDLRKMSETDRSSRMNTDEFRNKYSKQEQNLLRELSHPLPE